MVSVMLFGSCYLLLFFRLNQLFSNSEAAMLSKLEYKYSIVAGEGVLMLGFKFIENICGNSSEAWIQIQQGGFGRIF